MVPEKQEIRQEPNQEAELLKYKIKVATLEDELDKSSRAFGQTYAQMRTTITE